MVWDGIDRRTSGGRCPLHDGMVEWIKEEREQRKVDHKELKETMGKLLDRQQAHHDELADVKHIVSNGLQSTTQRTSESVVKLCAHVEEICVKNEARFVELEKFSWFRVWMNDLRDHVFKYIVIASALGGVAYVLINYGRETMTRLLK